MAENRNYRPISRRMKLEQRRRSPVGVPRRTRPGAQADHFGFVGGTRCDVIDARRYPNAIIVSYESACACWSLSSERYLTEVTEVYSFSALIVDWLVPHPTDASIDCLSAQPSPAHHGYANAYGAKGGRQERRKHRLRQRQQQRLDNSKPCDDGLSGSFRSQDEGRSSPKPGVGGSLVQHQPAEKHPAKRARS